LFSLNRQTYNRIDVVQEVVCLLHGGKHEVPKPGPNGKLLNDVEPELLPDYEQECDGYVVIALKQ